MRSRDINSVQSTAAAMADIATPVRSDTHPQSIRAFLLHLANNHRLRSALNSPIYLHGHAVLYLQQIIIERKTDERKQAMDPASWAADGQSAGLPQRRMECYCMHVAIGSVRRVIRVKDKGAVGWIGLTAVWRADGWVRWDGLRTDGRIGRQAGRRTGQRTDRQMTDWMTTGCRSCPRCLRFGQGLKFNLTDLGEWQLLGKKTMD